MKEKLKDKKVITGLVIGVIAIIGIIVFALMSMNSSDLKLKDKEAIVEYGQPVSKEASDYLDFDKVDNAKKDDILAKAKLDLTIENEAEKEYASIGEYKATITYNKDKAEFTIIVKDTTAPTFKDFKNSIEAAKDVKPDYSKLYVAEDLSEVNVSCDDANVKYDTVGEYKATLKATDTSKNETSKEITVKVIEPTIKLDKESTSLYVKETLVLKATITGKEQKATFKSSDDKIASVDAEGKITAKAKGTATITASANGKDATCKVTVKETPKGSSTTTKKDPSGNNVTVVTPPSNNNSSGNNNTLTQQISKEAFNIQNEKRAAAGVGNLEWDNELAQIALRRAKELSTDFSHKKTYRSDGRLVNAENAGKDYTSASLVVSGWYNSSGHRKAMLRDTYTKGAVARYGNYWVALFTK